MLAALMVATLTASAQNEVGQFTLKPAVGMTLANVTNYDGKLKVGLIAGVEAEYGVVENFSVAAGVFYGQQGAKNKDNSDYKTSLDYINIPIVAQYYVIPGLAIKAGIQPGFLVRAKEKYHAGGIDYDMDIKDDCKKFDLSIPFGISYEYQSFVLDARYNLGVTKAFKDDSRNKTSKNSVFMFTLGYKFAL